MISADDEPLNIVRDGAQRFRGAIIACLDDLLMVLASLPQNQAGVRINGIAALRPWLASEGPIGSIAAKVVGAHCRPVRAILFDKTPAANWSLGWHQDRTICVRHRVEVEGFGQWTIKGGMRHVAPPFELLARMVTLRVHLDDVSEDNAPLLIAPGSHREGRVSESEVDAVVSRCGTLTCLAEAGDVWLYATPILHASAAAKGPGPRRVLQIDYAAEALPGGLEWFGV